MAHTVDARGLACPQPVILARKAIAEHEEVLVLLNDDIARQNVLMLASGLGCSAVEERQGVETRITITRGETCALADQVICAGGPVVMVFSSSVMGRGDDTLGGVLMRSFLHTITEASPRPDIMIFLNTGVRLAVEGSEVLDDIRTLVESGVQVMSCGTCLNFLELREKLAVGSVTNMYDIAQVMLSAVRLIQV